jgi:hypothetical protein
MTIQRTIVACTVAVCIAAMLVVGLVLAVNHHHTPHPGPPSFEFVCTGASGCVPTSN